MSIVLECAGITKSYGQGDLREQVLSSVSLTFRRSETCILLGPSGSGKTTLLSIFGCLLSPTTGELFILGQRVNFSSSRQLSWLRRNRIGFVFQHAQLLPFLTVEENLSIVGQNAGIGRTELSQRIKVLLIQLGLEKFWRKFPKQLSGGEQQRVAIARAIIHRPSIILADEPTAALDRQNGEIVVQLLVEQCRHEESVLITVTHDTRLIKKFDRILQIDSGKVQNKENNP